MSQRDASMGLHQVVDRREHTQHAPAGVEHPGRRLEEAVQVLHVLHHLIAQNESAGAFFSADGFAGRREGEEGFELALERMPPHGVPTPGFGGGQIVAVHRHAEDVMKSPHRSPVSAAQVQHCKPGAMQAEGLGHQVVHHGHGRDLAERRAGSQAPRGRTSSKNKRSKGAQVGPKAPERFAKAPAATFRSGS